MSGIGIELHFSAVISCHNENNVMPFAWNCYFYDSPLIYDYGKIHAFSVGSCFARCTESPVG